MLKLPLILIKNYAYNNIGTTVPVLILKGVFLVCKKLISEIVDLLRELDEKELTYILNFVKKMFGSHV